jgi:hypothetical protein
MGGKMKSDQIKEKAKQAYQKPKLRTIELAAEEVLAAGCKINGSTMPGSGLPTSCGIGNNCVADGS